MTNRTVEPSAQHYASDGPPPARLGLETNRSIRKASLAAGIGILVMAALAVFGNFVVLEGLVTPGDAANTAEDIMDSEGMFRLGILSWFLIGVLDVVVGWALFRVFSPVNKGISMLAAWFRIVYAGVLMVGISQLVGVLRLLGNDDYLAVFSADQLHAQALLGINTFSDIWNAGLILFGLHLLVIGYLAFKSGYVPKLLGILLAIAGLGYVFDSFGSVLSGGSLLEISSFTFLGEFLLALWLVIWGRRITLSKWGFHEDPAEVAQWS